MERVSLNLPVMQSAFISTINADLKQLYDYIGYVTTGLRHHLTPEWYQLVRLVTATQ